MNAEPISQEHVPATSWPVRRVALRVQNLARSIDYYTRLGLSVVRDESGQGSGTVGLGIGVREVLQLRELAQGRARPRHSAGLYHFALLVPSETELGSFLQHCIEQHIPLAGASDHLVSQALYLSDPEGNGIEVYADRPREVWQFHQGSLVMDTQPLDVDNLLQQAGPFQGFSTGLRLGHMHLNVANLERSLSFYQAFGMRLMVGWGGQADFLSWDGYHHHLGINLWRGAGASPVTDDVYGLDFFEIHRPELSPAVVQDPDSITVAVS